MNFSTQFSPRDKVWCLDLANGAVTLLTVGQVRICLTDSDGIEGETMFDNYKPHQNFKEEYMCVESGIGTGTVFTLGKSIFGSREEAEIAARGES